MPITIQNTAGGGVTLDSTTTANETVNLPTGGGNLITTTGATFTGNVLHGDNVKSTFGAGDDLQIYHDGSDSYIKDATGTGNLYINSNQLIINNAPDNENMARFAEDGAVTLYNNGSAKIATTATGVVVTGGIAIGGTGAANTLDDYEEGTWTPVYSGSSTAGSFSYNYQNGRYTKVGNLVTVVCSLVDISQSSAASGSVHITGLPFSSSNIAALNSVGAVNLSRFNLDGQGQIVSIEGNTSYAQFVLMASGSGTGILLDAGDRTGNSADIFFTLTYRTDS